MVIHKNVTTDYYDDEGHHFTTMPIEDTLKIKKVKIGYEAKYLIHDEMPMSPDEWGDESLFLVHYHRDFWVERKKTIAQEELASLYRGEKIEQEKDYRIFPVKAYIHSGVSLSLGTGGFGHDPGGWDTSHVGVCLASKKEFPTKDKAEKACEGLVDEWNKYLGGDVYCLVKDSMDEDKKLVEHASVCGNYGYKDALKELEDFEG